MTKVDLKKLKKELKELEAGQSLTTTIMNTATTYNLLLSKLEQGENIQPYILAGINGQLYNQILNLKRIKQRQDSERKKLEEKNKKNVEEPDEFMQLVNKIKSH